MGRGGVHGRQISDPRLAKAEIFNRGSAARRMTISRTCGVDSTSTPSRKLGSAVSSPAGCRHAPPPCGARQAANCWIWLPSIGSIGGGSLRSSGSVWAGLTRVIEKTLLGLSAGRGYSQAQRPPRAPTEGAEALHTAQYTLHSTHCTVCKGIGTGKN